MANKNKHGLSRAIPAAVRRKVRQRCGFGCVLCGLAIYDFEHFDPEFKDATTHDPNGMTLLCPQCNQKKQRGLLSTETVRQCNADPRCLQRGFASEMFDFGTEEIEVRLGGARFINCANLVVVGETPILSIRKPEAQGQPYSLSGIFCNERAVRSLEIVDNQYLVSTDNWDVECKGPRITIRDERKRIGLRLKSEPPTRLIAEQLDLRYAEYRLRGSADALEWSHDGLRWAGVHCISVCNAATGIHIK